MTVRTLVLLRHAKSANPDDYATDFERPLAARGRADADAAGQWLLQSGLVPDAVLCSTAVRTRETWQVVSSSLGEFPIGYEQRLYDGGLADALQLIQQTAADVAGLLVIGHNPMLSVVSALLDPTGLTGDGLSTSGIAVHRMNAPWTAFDAATAPLVQSHTARS